MTASGQAAPEGRIPAGGKKFTISSKTVQSLVPFGIAGFTPASRRKTFGESRKNDLRSPYLVWYTLPTAKVLCYKEVYIYDC